MADLLLTGASRGIGHALALALAERCGDRLVLVARDRTRLDALAAAVEQKGGHAIAVPGALSSLKEAQALGQRLTEAVAPGATLIHNAGLWPAKRELTPEGLEAAFVINHLTPLVMQQPLLDAERLRRIMLVSAGLIVKARFDAARTPTGEDFSSIRTYCNTKLCFALAMRDIAAAYPAIDVVVLHPGVVRTDLGAPAPACWVGSSRGSSAVGKRPRCAPHALRESSRASAGRPPARPAGSWRSRSSRGPPSPRPRPRGERCATPPRTCSPPCPRPRGSPSSGASNPARDTEPGAEGHCS